MAALAVTLYFARRRLPRLQPLLAPFLGISLGFAVLVHLGDDLPAARTMREQNYGRLSAIDALLPPEPAAIFAHGVAALGPLLLDRDLVLVEMALDKGKDTPVLLAALDRSGRRIFAILPGLSESEQSLLSARHHFLPVEGSPSVFVELKPKTTAP